MNKSKESVSAALSIYQEACVGVAIIKKHFSIPQTDQYLTEYHRLNTLTLLYKCLGDVRTPLPIILLFVVFHFAAAKLNL